MLESPDRSLGEGLLSERLSENKDDTPYPVMKNTEHHAQYILVPLLLK